MTRRSLFTLGLLALLLSPRTADAQNVVRLHAIVDSDTFDGDGDAVEVETKGLYGSALLDIAGAIGGGSTITLTCLGDFDGATYVARPLTGPQPASTTDTDGAVTVTGQYVATISGCQKVKATASSWGTGAPVVTLTASSSGGAGSGSSSSGGTTTDADDASIATGQTNDNVNALMMAFDTAAWRRVTFGTAGSASAQVFTVQGIASMTPFLSNPGTASLWGVHAEDSAHATTHPGVQILGVRQSAQVSFGADGDYVPLSINDSGEVRVAFSGAAGGTSIADDGDFTAGTTAFTPGGGFYQSAVTACTDGDTCAAGITAQRAWKVTLFTEAGAAITPSTDVTEDAAETAGGTGPMVMSVRRDTAASSAGTTGDNATFNTSAEGLLWTRHMDPCSGLGKTYIPIDIVTATTTEITASLAGASTHYYICSVALVTAGANNVAIVDDDSDNCASVTSGVMGGTTAGEGFNLAANGGLTLGNGNGSIARTVGTNRVLCIVTSAAVQLSGSITVVAAP